MKKFCAFLALVIFLNYVRGQREASDEIDEDDRDTFNGPNWVNQLQTFGPNQIVGGLPGNQAIGNFPGGPQLPTNGLLGNIPGGSHLPTNELLGNVPGGSQLTTNPGFGPQFPSFTGTQQPSFPVNPPVSANPGFGPSLPGNAPFPVNTGIGTGTGINQVSNPTQIIGGSPFGGPQIPGQNFPSNFPAQRTTQATSTLGSEGSITPTTQPPAIRNCIASCPVTPEYNPVCGSNNVTYDNPGRLNCAQACGINVNLLRMSRCNVPQ